MRVSSERIVGFKGEECYLFLLYPRMQGQFRAIAHTEEAVSIYSAAVTPDRTFLEQCNRI